MKRVLVDDRINHHSVTSKTFLDDPLLERCATDFGSELGIKPLLVMLFTTEP